MRFAANFSLFFSSFYSYITLTYRELLYVQDYDIRSLISSWL